MHQNILITQAGLDTLKAELADLVDNRRPAQVARLTAARDMGDLSENSDYISAKEELTFIDGRIAELEDIIRIAKVTTPSSNSQISFGHTVTVRVNSTHVVYKIVGEWVSIPTRQSILESLSLSLALARNTARASL
ncbi:MAG: Transcription elongation factor GreA [Candidatus Amesbacteria bacterium GW2011_GWA1_48_9]|uniref:Transcription elongation factor GreA n=1 Tax=Candidatus Amesbacteria bacterium GW2011_GWA1_48_9 TaxID=1618355 RepID=A0A0G1V2K2_9BACT|nr:MAG: Transcription elongation factor GreA [Candidatus Amesbacteria bacterium GW2011_GWA1_48_9]